MKDRSSIFQILIRPPPEYYELLTPRAFAASPQLKAYSTVARHFLECRMHLHPVRSRREL